MKHVNRGIARSWHLPNRLFSDSSPAGPEQAFRAFAAVSSGTYRFDALSAILVRQEVIVNLEE